MVKKPIAFLRRIAGGIWRRLCPEPQRKSYMELTHEKNLWLFDRISLGRLFLDAGFQNVSATDFFTSSIPGWKPYNFDHSAYGHYPLEPSLFMEGNEVINVFRGKKKIRTPLAASSTPRGEALSTHHGKQQRNFEDSCKKKIAYL